MRCDLWPAHHARHAHAAFIDGRLSSPQRRVARRRGAVHLVIHVTAVVGGEDDSGAVSDAEPVERVEQLAHAVVHRLDHRRVSRAALRVGWVHAGAIFFDERLLRIERRVDGELPVVQKKRAVLVRLHPCHRLIAHAILDVLGGRALLEVLELPRCHETPRRPRPSVMRHVRIEAMLQRRIRLRPEMPFAKMRRRIARLLQRLREGEILRVEAGRALALQRLVSGRRGLLHRRRQLHLGQMAVRRGDSSARGILPRQQARPRGRAQRAGRIRAREKHPAFRQPLEIRGLVKLRSAIERRVAPPEVVGEDEDDIRPHLRGARAGAEQGDQRETCDAQREQSRSVMTSGHGVERPGGRWGRTP